MPAHEGMNRTSVLLVDDEPAVLKVLERLLESESYTLLTANGSAEAMALLEKRPVDILLSDYNMPEIDGIELASLACRIRPGLITILLTGHGDHQLAKTLINGGLVYKYIEKPWGEYELTDAVRDAAVRHRLEESNRELQSRLTSRNAELEDLTSGLMNAVTRLKGELQSALRHAGTNERFAQLGRAAVQIAHDLRSPLTTLSLSMDMMKLKSDGDGSVVAGGIMEKALEQISAMVEALPASVRQITTEPELQPTDLDQLLYHAADLMLPIIANRTVYLECDAHTGVLLNLDRLQMTITIENLLKNAVEAVVAGGHIRMSARLDQDSAVIEVEDSGPGLADEIRAKLFTPFATFGKPNGTGLGLAGAKSAVEHHGGTICGENTGHGARFTIRLPRSLVVEDSSGGDGRSRNQECSDCH